MTAPPGDRGFSGALVPGERVAVLAIDLMAAYFTPGSPFCLPSRDCLGAAAQVLDAARAAGVPVIHTRVSYVTGVDDDLVFLRKIPALRALSGDSEMGRIEPQVAPVEGEPVLVKQQASAFFGTDLDDRLRALGVDTVLIVGVSTSGCVRATAVEAIARDYVPFVVREAVADRTPAIQEASLFDLQAKYADVIDLAAAIRLLATSHGG